MNIVKFIIIIFLILNVIINLVWDGLITFKQLDRLEKMMDRNLWTKFKDFFQPSNQLTLSKRIISSINLCFMVPLTLLFLFTIFKDRQEAIIYSIIYVSVRTMSVALLILSTTKTEEIKSTLPSAAFQIFVLVLIILTYCYKINNNTNKQTPLYVYCVFLIFLIVIPFMILRFFPSDFSIDNISNGLNGNNSNIKCYSIEGFKNNKNKMMNQYPNNKKHFFF